MTTLSSISAIILPPDPNDQSLTWAQFNAADIAYEASLVVAMGDVNTVFGETRTSLQAAVTGAEASALAASASASDAATDAGLTDGARADAATAKGLAEDAQAGAEFSAAAASALGPLDPATGSPGDLVQINGAGDDLEFVDPEAAAAAYLISQGATGGTDGTWARASGSSVFSTIISGSDVSMTQVEYFGWTGAYTITAPTSENEIKIYCYEVSGAVPTVGFLRSGGAPVILSGQNGSWRRYVINVSP